MPAEHPTVVHMLADAAARAPDHEALVCGTERLTYAEYAGCVGALAADLAGTTGRIALLLRNAPDIAIAIFAVQAAGAQVVPLNPDYTAYELRPILTDAAPALALYDAPSAATIAPVLAELGIPGIAIGPGARRLIAVPPQPLPLPDPAALSTLQYTGGTTGRAKGVDLRHAAVATNVRQRDGLLPTRPDTERVLAITPLFHVYAASMGLYLAVHARGTLVIMPRYRPADVLDAIAAERITLLSGSPTIFAGLLAYEGFPSADLSTLSCCYSGASALPEALLHRWQTATNTVVCEGYGQTEAGPVLAFNPSAGTRKPGTVGIPAADTDIQIVDVQTGTRILPTGEQGEIRARGPQLMAGYRNLPTETAAALRDGWLYTGDIGWLDCEGYLSVCDRKKDMAIVSGFNVYPREVEEALHTHPAIMEAAVIGIPDPYRGEQLRAYVVPHPNTSADPASLDAHLRARLTRYKIPQTITVLPHLPKTVIGKIDKPALRTHAAETSHATDTPSPSQAPSPSGRGPG